MPRADPDDFRSDDELGRAYQRGDARAVAELVRRHEARLRAFVFGDPRWVAAGDDIVRHTWAEALRLVREGRFRGGSFRAWLFKVGEAVAGQRVHGAHHERGETLCRCFAKLRKANLRWHQTVMWVSHGVNRTAAAKRLRVSKARLRRRYTRAVAAVKQCVEKATRTGEGAAT